MKSPEIQRGDGFESSTVHKPNAALEAFEELVEAAEGKHGPAAFHDTCDHMGRTPPLFPIQKMDGDWFVCRECLRQALTRAGEIRKALTERKGD